MQRQNTLRHFRDLEVYQIAFNSAMNIFEMTKGFPVEDNNSFVDQVRRSSRSVCTNLAEAWRKRKYIAVFKNKLTDSMQEASETQSWLEFCSACNYINDDLFRKYDKEYELIISMLNSLEKRADKFTFKSSP
jgi:four helix bundle protein